MVRTTAFFCTPLFKLSISFQGSRFNKPNIAIFFYYCHTLIKLLNWVNCNQTKNLTNKAYHIFKLENRDAR